MALVAWVICSAVVLSNMKLCFATNNLGKQQEIKELLSDLDIEVVFPDDLPECKDVQVIESGKTYQENSLIKARAYAEASGLLTAADDSGLAVEALNGQPGVQSARWIKGSDHDRNLALLQALKPFQNRLAKFETIISFYDPKTTDYRQFYGKVEGKIIKQEMGSSGFGYDPIFKPIGHNKTFSQLSQREKNLISHRAIAFKDFKNHLKRLINRK